MTTAEELFRDLTGQSKARRSLSSIIDESDPYSQAGDVLGQFRYKPYKAGDENTAIGVGLAQALVKGILEGTGTNYRAKQRRALGSLFPNYESGDFSDADPAVLDELDSDVLSEFVLRSKEDKVLRDRAEAEARRKLQERKDIIKYEKGFDLDEALVSNSPTVRRAMAKNRLQELGIFDEPSSGRLGAFQLEEEPAAVIPEETIPSSRASSEERAQRAYEETLVATDSEKQAEQAAQFVRDRAGKETDRELGEIGKARDAQRELQSYLTGVEDSIDRAAAQGLPLQDVITGVGNLVAFFDKEEGAINEAMADRQVLDSLSGLATKFFRTVGEGQITEREVSLFQKGLPTLNKSRAANKAALKRLVKFFDEGREYIDLKERFIRKQGGLEGFSDAYQDKLQSLMSTAIAGETGTSQFTDEQLLAEKMRRAQGAR